MKSEHSQSAQSDAAVKCAHEREKFGKNTHSLDVYSREVHDRRKPRWLSSNQGRCTGLQKIMTFYAFTRHRKLLHIYYFNR